MDEGETLKLLGLSPMQAHVYLTLVQAGRSSAKTLAKQACVARPDIYRIMANFEKMGLIQTTITSPTMYEAIKIEHALQHLVNRKIDENRELKKKVAELIIKMGEKQNSKKNDDGPDVCLMPATKIAERKRRELINKAQKSIDVIGSYKFYKLLLSSKFNRLTRKAIGRGVAYRLLIEIPQGVCLPLEHTEALDLLKRNGSEMKYITNCPAAIVTIYDKKEALVFTSNKAGINDTPLLWINNNSLISVMNGYFEHLWTTTPETGKNQIYL